MKGSIRHIFSNLIIILMMLLVSLPCEVKREVKQTLNIPVAPFEKPKIIICADFTKVESKEFYVFYRKRNLTKPDCTFNLDAVFPLHHYSLPVFKFKNAGAVPIYILHEQYLI